MDEAELYLRRQRSRRLLAGGVLVALVVAGVGAAISLWPTPCQRFVQQLCAGRGVPGCDELADRLVQAGVSDEACAETLHALDQAMKETPTYLHDSMRAHALKLLVEEQLGVGISLDDR